MFIAFSLSRLYREMFSSNGKVYCYRHSDY